MTVWVPGLELNGALLPYVVVAVAMVVITIFVLGLVLASDRRPPLVTQMLLTFTVVGGGSILLLALVFAFLDPNGTDAWTWVLAAFNFMMAVPVGIWFVSLVIFRDRRVSERGWFWPLLLGGATTGSEMLMGVLFAVGTSNGATAGIASVADGLSSVWYFGSMAAVMAGLVAWSRRSPSETAVARGLLLTALAAPWVGAYPTVGGLVVAAVMAGVVASVLRRLLLRGAPRAEAGFLLLAALAFLAMSSAGLGLVASGGSDAARLAFGAVMGAVMTGEVGFLIRACYAGGPGVVAVPSERLARGAAGGSTPAGGPG